MGRLTSREGLFINSTQFNLPEDMNCSSAIMIDDEYGFLVSCSSQNNSQYLCFSNNTGNTDLICYGINMTVSFIRSLTQQPGFEYVIAVDTIANTGIIIKILDNDLIPIFGFNKDTFHLDKM